MTLGTIQHTTKLTILNVTYNFKCNLKLERAMHLMNFNCVIVIYFDRLVFNGTFNAG
jgi:hypothetical protein